MNETADIVFWRDVLVKMNFFEASLFLHSTVIFIWIGNDIIKIDLSHDNNSF